MEHKYGSRLRVTGIPKNEPLFLFRAQDVYTPRVLDAYSRMLRADGHDEMADRVQTLASVFVDWQVIHHEKVKVPD